MAAQPVHDPSPHEEALPEASLQTAAPNVKAIGDDMDTRHVASPARTLQARIATEFAHVSKMSARRIFSMILVVCLSTWLAVFVLYATL